MQRALRDDITLVLYDRAGLGWSDPGPWRRTAGRMADELHRLLSEHSAQVIAEHAGHHVHHDDPR